MINSKESIYTALFTKMKRRFLYVVLFTFFSCNSIISKDQLTSNVRNSINTDLSKKASEKNMSFSIYSFVLVHISGNEYSAVLNTNEGGKDYTYEVNVTVDGDSYVWKIVN